VPARRAPDPERPRYVLRLDVRPERNTVTGDLRVRFVPDRPIDRLVFRLWPNGPRSRAAGARLDVGPIALDGAPARPGDLPDPTTLVVRLGRTVAAGRSVTAALPWKLTLPGAVPDRVARIGDTVRLGSFFPILAWEPGRGWATEPPTSNFAEASTAPTADFDLHVTTSPGLQVIASGVPDGPGRWRADAARDVAVSVGRFRTAVAVAHAPQPVTVTVAVDTALTEQPSDYLVTVVRALEDFARRYGPYPWPVYSLAVTPQLRGGIEYPMHVLQGPGSGGRTTPHEVAHQWFYALVGNDQGRDPWLDEGLASWAEARFLGNLGHFLSLTIPSDARGRLGAPMTYWNGRSSYYRGVYVQGVQFLARLGSPDQVDCALRQLVARHAHRVARPIDLLAALRFVFPNAQLGG
jgi:hypothetical protein